MPLYLLLMMSCALSISGDVFCKHATKSVGQWMYFHSAMTFICWGSGVFFWKQIYSRYAISEMVAIYNPFHMVVLATAGFLLFNEPLTAKLILSYVLIGMAIWLMTT